MHKKFIVATKVLNERFRMNRINGNPEVIGTSLAVFQQAHRVV